ncbi:MAG: di-trans,poly-cis-decaprenylcistransferase, partial [Polyangiaceae bacterium]|nr:di-trans,poly-cis-decaprenylcistransferase [Polyangiaceae bacterium]
MARSPRGSSAHLSLVDLHRLPKHVAIIMDGNGRWAQSLGRVRTSGHEQGSHAVRRIVRSSRRLGVEALTLYAFSEQNWNRPPYEVSALMELLRRFLVSERDELLDNGIRLRAIGRTSRLPERVREVLEPLAEETKDLTGMTLSLALSYGGREELVDAARIIAERAQRGELDPADVDEALIDSLLASSDVGPVDLMIRTGGEQRVSNFLLWGAAYAELHFTPKLWPDFEEADLYAAVAAFQGRERRFGLVP